jgi:hypothetical protein
MNKSYIEVSDPSSAVQSIHENWGWQFGLMADYKVLPFIHFTPKAELAFNSGEVNFKGVQSDYVVMPKSINIVPMLRIELELGKRDPYVLVGANFKFPYDNKNTSPSTFGVEYNQALEIGFGYQKRVLFYDFAPEIRYSYGLKNINQNPLLTGLYQHQLAIVFNFY